MTKTRKEGKDEKNSYVFHDLPAGAGTGVLGTEARGI